MLLVAATAIAVVTTRPHPSSDTTTAAAVENAHAANAGGQPQPGQAHRSSRPSGRHRRIRSGPGALPNRRPRARRAQATATWSTPATLSACPGRWPNVLFPSKKPTEGTGPGAIVFNDAPSCPGGAGARVAALGQSEQPQTPAKPREASGSAIAVEGPLSSTAGPHGQIVIAGLQPGSSAGNGKGKGKGLIVQGEAGQPFTRLSSTIQLSRPFALSTAYLGDAAIAMPDTGHGPLVQVERFFADTLSAPRVGPNPKKDKGPIRDLTVAMDFRSDALAAWVQGSSIYAQDLPGSGVRHPVERIGPAAPNTTLTALLSDDNRGMVVWQETSGKQTSVHFDYSATGVKFGPATTLESYANPDGLKLAPTTPRLIRLASESVMMAWAGVANGHWVVRTAAIDQNGIGMPSTIAAPQGDDALLADLEPGPNGEALALFSEPQPSLAGKPDTNRQALLVARGVDVAPDRTSFSEPQLVAPPGPVQGASIGIDPDTDDAVAAWEGEAGSIEYSVRAAG
jgi:hypothetical protein